MAGRRREALRPAGHDAEQRRRRDELRAYLESVKGKIDLGDDFEAKASAQEASWKELAAGVDADAADAAAKDAALRDKIERGREKIKSLDKKLEELELRQEGPVGTPTATPTAAEPLPALQLPPVAKGAARRKVRRRRERRPKRRSTEGEGEKEQQEQQQQQQQQQQQEASEGAEAERRLDFVARNAELASTAFSRVLTDEEDRRLEEMMLEDMDDLGYAGSGEHDGEPGPEMRLVVSVDARSLVAEEEDAAAVDESIKLLVGPEEWESKSQYFNDEEGPPGFGDEGALGPLLSARSCSQLSTLSAASAGSVLQDLRQERLAEERLRRIDQALENVSRQAAAPAAREQVAALLEQARSFVDTALNGEVADSARIGALLRELQGAAAAAGPAPAPRAEEEGGEP